MGKMKTYYGSRLGDDFALVTIHTRHTTFPLGMRLDLANHSPGGFEWGYAGSGPAQLALAILADCLGDDGMALRLYQRFKDDVIGRLPRDDFRLSEEQVKEWVEKAR